MRAVVFFLGQASRQQRSRSCTITALACPNRYRVGVLCALRIRYPRQAIRRWLGFPNHSAQDLAMTCPPSLARAITGQLHSTVLCHIDELSVINEQAPTLVPSDTDARKQRGPRRRHPLPGGCHRGTADSGTFSIELDARSRTGSARVLASE